MARIRSVKPGFFSSLDIADLKITTRLHFIGLWTYADDEGRGVDDPRLIKAALWPLDTDITPDVVEEMQQELVATGRIVRYQVGGRPFFEIVNWHSHQKPNRPQDSKYPPPSDADDSEAAPSGPPSVSPHEPLTDDSVNHHSVSNGDGSQEGSGGERRGEDPSADGASEGLIAAVSTACRHDRIPPPDTRAWQQLEVATADIARHGATPHEVPARAREYRRRWPDAELTPMALAKHWPQLTPPKPNVPREYDPTPALRAAGLDDRKTA